MQKISDGGTVRAFESIQKVDIRASEEINLGYVGISMAKDKRKLKTMDAVGSVLIKPAYDGKSIISAMVTNVLDKDNSILTITEWDENLRAINSTDHKIPFRAYTPKKTYLHRDPRVWDVVKDKNGFVYVQLRSGNPKDEDDSNLDWIYQFKLSDPSYMKVFKKELSKGFGIIRLSLDQDASGKVFISSVGNQGDEDNSEKYFVNAALIGSFNDAGQLETIFANQLTDEMMYNFSSEKKVGKKGGVNTLRIRDILPASNGGCYVIWQYEWTEIKDNYRGDSKSKYIDDNVLVQFFSKDKKIVWEKPVYKHQVTKDNISGSYSGYSAFVVNDDLHFFYPDDKKNAGKSADDKDVATFSVVQFGDRDLSGIFSLTYKMNGTVERNYINWPDEKVGYAFLVGSMKYIGNNQFIGTARKIKQGALFLKAEQYAFFKLAF